MVVSDRPFDVGRSTSLTQAFADSDLPADVDLDGVIDLADVLLIQQAVAP